MIGMAIYAALGAILIGFAVVTRRPRGEFKLVQRRTKALETLRRMHRS